MAEHEDAGDPESEALMSVSVDFADKLVNAIGEWRISNRLRPGTPPPMVAGRYQPHQWLGTGGMGGVFRATDTKLGREVALKVLARVRKDAASELAHEAQCVAKIRSSRVVTVYDSVECPEFGMVLVMELIPGVSARDWAQARKRSWQDKLQVWVKAGRGIEAAHEAGVLHGDVKPGNVLVEKSGEVKVVDFGIARILGGSPLSDAEEGVVAGTFIYMAPERIEGRPFDARADQFSFCAVLWEQVTGKLPFPGKSESEILTKIATTNLGLERMPKDVPPRLQAILVRGLSSNPDERYPSMGELLHDLDPLLPPKNAPRRSLFALLVLLVLLVPLAALWGAWMAESDEHDLVIDPVIDEASASTLDSDASEGDAPSIEVVVAMAKSGDPMQAWVELQKVEETQNVEVEDLLLIAQTLKQRAELSEGRQRAVTVEVGQRIARRGWMLAAGTGDTQLRAQAKQLFEQLERVSPSNPPSRLR